MLQSQRSVDNVQYICKSCGLSLQIIIDMGLNSILLCKCFVTETELKATRETVGPRSKSSQWVDYATPTVRAFQQSHIYYPYAATCTYLLKHE